MKEFELDLITRWKNKKVFEIENERFKRKVFIHPYNTILNTYDYNNSTIYPALIADVYNRYYKMCGDNVMMGIGFNEFTLKSNDFLHDYHQTSYSLYKNYLNTLDMVGVGYDRKKTLSLNMPNVISFYQNTFLKLFNRNIFLKKGLVYVDKTQTEIYNNYQVTVDGMSAYLKDNGTDVFLKEKEYIALDISQMGNEIKKMIKESNLTLSQKDALYNDLGEYSYIELTFNNYREKVELTVDVYEPELIAGIGFIALNPSFMDVYPYVMESEKSIVEKYCQIGYTEGVYTGNTVKNPLTGEDIFIFVSHDFDEAIHLGIPQMSEKDMNFANKLGLDFNNVIENGVLVNSEFLNGLTREEAKIKIISTFLDEGMAVSKTAFKLKEIILSRYENNGLIVPIVENPQTYLPEPLNNMFIPVYYNNRGKITYTNEEKIPSNIELIKMVFNDTFVNSLSHIVSYELENDFRMLNSKSLNCEHVYFVNKNNLIEEFLLANIFDNLLGNNKSKKFIVLENPILKNSIIKEYNSLQLSFVSDILKDKNPDAYRMFVLSKNFDTSFENTRFKIKTYEQFLTKIKTIYLNGFVDSNHNLDLKLEELLKNLNYSLNEYNISEYIKTIMNFTDEVLTEEVMTEYQSLQFLKLLSIIIPYSSQYLYENVYDQSYFIVYDSWPFLK